jgi:serine/threonine protein kinase
LLTDGYYNYKMDMWGVGCVMFEIVALYPLFPGELLYCASYTFRCPSIGTRQYGAALNFPTSCWWSLYMTAALHTFGRRALLCQVGCKLPIVRAKCIFSQQYGTCLSCSGNNELDQIQKIHTIIGTPPPELLAKLKKRSSHSSSFDFPQSEGSGLPKMLSHVHPDCADLISKLLAYNPDERLSARQALRHPYFRRVQQKR